MFEIPEELKYYVIAQDCSNFDTKTYYITEQVNEIKKSIKKTKEKSHVMQSVLGLTYPNTTLLYGPPGTGKTSLCKYLAHEFNIPFVYLNFARIFNGVFGKTSEIISKAFEFISAHECIFCLDEVDAISQRRGTESDVTGGEISRVTITLMQSIDMLKDKDSSAIIVGCTNRVDIMDEALRSRFSVQFMIRSLTNEEEFQYIEKYLIEVNKKLKKAGMKEIKKASSRANIEEYCSKSFSLSQRDVEMDLTRCISLWLDDTSKKFNLEHVRRKAI